MKVKADTGQILDLLTDKPENDQPDPIQQILDLLNTIAEQNNEIIKNQSHILKMSSHQQK
ncbi:hypothetical protein B0W47_02120 [Komagataeibacter nataicola]|uniref:Uncharacterized protein n=2 Tax=Komagataeibacter TaxID=1434011 RepID=A0A9N7GZC2_9PROT|nr:hypothetical protein B0W47_02120 [Komagataeibacter nataicola]PYD65871.1 hypothetical protein CDI09_11425 [Komagataeibacter nataicola]PYD80010.1 hypothetical protein CFR77_05740 [Komagataeibacter sucrofermentans]